MIPDDFDLLLIGLVWSIAVTGIIILLCFAADAAERRWGDK